MTFRVEVKRHDFKWIFFVEAKDRDEAQEKAVKLAEEDGVFLEWHRMEISDA
jgi:hypothetical protein